MRQHFSVAENQTIEYDIFVNTADPLNIENLMFELELWQDYDIQNTCWEVKTETPVKSNLTSNSSDAKNQQTLFQLLKKFDQHFMPNSTWFVLNFNLILRYWECEKLLHLWCWRLVGPFKKATHRGVSNLLKLHIRNQTQHFFLLLN